MNKVCRKWCENLINRFNLVTALEGKNYTTQVLTLIAKDYQTKSKSYRRFENDLEISSLRGFDCWSAAKLWSAATRLSQN